MDRHRLGLIGYGAIGRAVIDRLTQEGALDEIVAVLVRSGRTPHESLPFCDRLEAFLSARPKIVIEAAGQEAVVTMAAAVLDAGADLVASSVGALMDDRLAAALAEPRTGRGRLLVPSGAIAGLDGLAAARIGGLDSVSYGSYKPPGAWKGTAAEDMIDLKHQEEEVTFFEGSAREAALRFPRNANVSAAIALAGLGPDRTHVRLVSSRKVSEPLGVVEASGAFGWFSFKIFARAFPSNPKSSMLTAYSLLQCARYGIGVPILPALEPARRSPRNTLSDSSCFARPLPSATAPGGVTTPE